MSWKRGIVTALPQVAEFMGNILIEPHAMIAFSSFLFIVCCLFADKLNLSQFLEFI